MRRATLRAVAVLAILASAAAAQTPAKAAPCDSASVLLTAQPIYGAGIATRNTACPMFASAIDAWFVKNAAVVGTWTAAQTVAFISHGVPPAVAPPVVVPPPVVVEPPPVVTAPGNVCANEPAGATRFEDQAWNTALPAQWVDDGRDWGAKGSVVSDATAPLSPPSAVAGLFKKGSVGGSAPFYVYRPFGSSEQFTTLYLCVVVKFSSDFDNTNGNSGSKFLWPAGDQIGGAYTYLTFNAATMDVGVNQQGGIYDPDGREMYANLGVDGHVYNKRGRWIVLEYLLKANSAESAKDGALDVWIDGAHTHQYRDVRWRMVTPNGSNPGRTWKSLAWNPTYGGGLNPVPHDQYEYIDHLRLSGR